MIKTVLPDRRARLDLAGRIIGRLNVKRTLSLLAALWLTTGTVPAWGGDRVGPSGDLAGQSLVEAPVAVVPEAAFHFGETIEGTVVEHAFVIQNQGNAPLAVLGVETGCGCTNVLRPDPIAPGTSGQLIVHVDTWGYGDEMFDTTVTASTNAPDTPEIHFQVAGRVTPFARIAPPRITLAGRAGESLSASVSITPNPAQPFRVTGVQADDRLKESIDVRYDRQNGTYRIVVMNRQPDAGTYRGRIVIDTDSALRPQLTVYVIGNISH